MRRNKKAGRAGKASWPRPTTTAQGRSQGFSSTFLHKFAGGHAEEAFSLRDEARNTAVHNQSMLGQDARLRTRPVAFVSAGLIEPLRDLELKDEDNRRAEDGGNDIPPASGVDTLVLDQPRDLLPSHETGTDAAVPREVETIRKNARRDISTSPDVQADDPFYIDTAGDKTLASANKHLTPRVPDPQSSVTDSDSSEDVVIYKGRNTGRKPVQRTISLDDIKVQIKAVEKSMQQTNMFPGATADLRTSPYEALLESESRGEEVRGVGDDAILADYIANMSDDENGHVRSSRFVVRDLGGTDDEINLKKSASDGTASDDPQDERQDLSDSSEGSDRAPSAGGGTGTDGEGEEEEEAAIDMDDETLARMLAKQEELGLGGDDLVLFSEDVGATGAISKKERSPHSLREKGMKMANAGHSKRSRSKFPNATALADAFEDFDPLDWAQAPPARTKKGKRGGMDFGVSDSELEEHLEAVWQKDRLRKKEKKIEREELRTRGLLGKNINPDEPVVKYQAGMNLDEIREELRAFLLSSNNSLSLPPMDASARKIIHELAHRFKVKSKSAGSGDQRHPVLYRTKATMSYVETDFDQHFARVGRRRFPRLDAKGRSVQRTAGGGRVNHAAVTYRDGEVVGASAPELGQSNKGRNMLEKMGWSSGMALGSMDNKGILQPVVHVVKRTKAGLG